MIIVNSLLKPRLLLPICVALAIAGHPFPTSGVSWFDELGMTSAHADDDDDRYGDDDDRHWDDRYGDDRDDRYDDDDDGDDD